MRRRLFLHLLFSSLAFAQPPQISAGGVVSAASWSSLTAPGELIAIFGMNFGSASGGTSVTINGVPAPVTFVSPTQINAQVPASLSTFNSVVTSASVVVSTAAGASAPELVGLAGGAPGFFTADSSGCGQASALIVRPDGTVSVNSPTNSAAPGDYIAVFGTGFGLATQQPPDGVASAGASTLKTPPSVYLDRGPVTSLAYAGLAPGLPGVDQINLQLPASIRNGCNVPVSAFQTWPGPEVTLSIEGGRGKCADPPVESYGTISLNKYFLPAAGSTPANTTESFSASFPSGPNMQPAAPEEFVFAPGWAVNTSTAVFRTILSEVPINPVTCPVPGYSNLSAGAIQIQPPTGSGVTVVPSSGIYENVLPEGFIGPGTYTFMGTPGNAVNLNATLNIGSPIQIQSTFAAGTAISSSQPLTVKWTGGDSGTLVRVALASQNSSIYSYADAGSGSLTITPQCTSGVCTYGLPLSTNAQVSVSVLPASSRIGAVSVPGVTGPVQLTWQYSYAFANLTLTN